MENGGNYEFVGNLIIKGKIICETGLLIGGTEEMIRIGGADKQPIMDLEGIPYIPGSSLKGKIRSLLEWYYKKVEKSGIHTCKDANSAKECPICRVFGVPGSDNLEIGPTRLIFRDAYPTKETIERLNRYGSLEIKTENVIDRITSKSSNLRTFERVPKNSEFEMEMVFGVYRLENEDNVRDVDFLETVFIGLKLLENSALGSSGSRGYGKIRFDGMECIWKSVDDYKYGREGTQCNFELEMLKKIIG